MRGVLRRLLALGAAVVAAVAAWVAAAALRPGLAFLALVALAAFLATGHLLLRLADPEAGRKARIRRAAWLAVGAVMYMTTAHLLVGRTPARALDEPTPPADVGHGILPDGAAIAYLRAPPEGRAHDTPVLFLHGGPGVPVLPIATYPGTRFLDFLTREGYAVYYYDQRGAGFSDRLDLRTGRAYSVDLHVRDLEAVRGAIGAERLILAGHGWGATLAAQYLLAHPDRVERFVALAPAPLWAPAFPEMIDPAARARLTEAQASALALLERPPLRLLIGRLTASTSRRAAHSLVHDWEADQWWTRAVEESRRLGQPNMTCSTEPERGLPPVAGLGFFSYSYTASDALRLPDPRPALARTATPTLVVRGLCDHIRWEVAYEYLQVMPGAQYVSIPAGGHLLWVEQQALLEQVIRPFLAGEAVPLSYYHPSGGSPGR